MKSHGRSELDHVDRSINCSNQKATKSD